MKGRKIVFLVNVDDLGDPHSRHLTVLCILRVLIAFSFNHNERRPLSRYSRKNLCWGFKFFSYRTLAAPTTRCKFVDYEVGNFKEFVAELERQALLTDATTPVYPPEKQLELIRRSLFEVVADFPWCRPDILSPGKNLLRKRPGIGWPNDEESVTGLSNGIIILSRCPDTNNAIDGSTSHCKIFSEALCGKLKTLFLIWIDGCSRTSVALVKDDHQSLSNALSKCNGFLLPQASIADRLYGHDNQLTPSGHDCSLPSAAPSRIGPLSVLLNGILEKRRPQLSVQRQVVFGIKDLHADLGLKEATNIATVLLPVSTMSSTKTVDSEPGSPKVEMLKCTGSDLHPSAAVNRLKMAACCSYYCLPKEDCAISSGNCWRLLINCLMEKDYVMILNNVDGIPNSLKILQPFAENIGILHECSCQIDQLGERLDNASSTMKMKDVIKDLSKQASSTVDFDAWTVLEPWYHHLPVPAFPDSFCNQLSVKSQSQSHRKSHERKRNMEFLLKKYIAQMDSDAQKSPSVDQVTEMAAASHHDDDHHMQSMQTQLPENIDEEQLKEIISEQLALALTKDPKACEMTAVDVVKLTHKYYNQKSLEERAPQFLEDHVLYQHEKLKLLADDSSKDFLSCILHLHLFLNSAKLFACHFIADDEKMSGFVAAIVQLLRGISFYKDPAFTSKYLRSILPRYMSDIPQLLIAIYDGLMQDVPPELITPSKMCSSSDESPFKAIFSQPSVCTSVESLASCQGDRKFTRRQSSLADCNVVRKEITIRPKTKKKGGMKHVKERIIQESSSMRRNLFNADSFNSPVKNAKDGKNTLGQETFNVSVKETPVRKQTKHLLWKLQHKERKRSNTVTSRTVVKESPLKDEEELSAARSSRSSRRFYSQSQPTESESEPRFARWSSTCSEDKPTEERPADESASNYVDNGIVQRTNSVKRKLDVFQNEDCRVDDGSMENSVDWVDVFEASKARVGNQQPADCTVPASLSLASLKVLENSPILSSVNAPRKRRRKRKRIAKEEES